MQDQTSNPAVQNSLNDIIGEQLIHCVGSPSDLFRVHVRPLWKDHYRVNVFVGKDATSALIASSYFLRADGEGNILTSSPEISKRY
jgi:predicted NBD/HSP70 family sugar kinase